MKYWWPKIQKRPFLSKNCVCGSKRDPNCSEVAKNGPLIWKNATANVCYNNDSFTQGFVCKSSSAIERLRASRRPFKKSIYRAIRASYKFTGFLMFLRTKKKMFLEKLSELFTCEKLTLSTGTNNVIRSPNVLWANLRENVIAGPQ